MRRTLTHGPKQAGALFVLLWLIGSVSLRAGNQAAAPGQDSGGDPFRRGSWSLELTGHGAVETWNYNISHEEMLAIVPGVSRGIGRGVALKVAFPLYRVWQRGTDAYLLGATWGVRGRIAGRRRTSLFWEFEVGVSEADTYVPPRGTRFNYLALGGIGATVRVRPGLHALAGLRWIHVSNNSLAGRDRNPDIEAVGPTLGLLLGF